MVHRPQLLEKEDSGFRALIRDDKVEDLSRLFCLYNGIPEGLDFGTNLFKQHITSEGTTLIQQVKDASPSLVQEIIKLHKRCMEYVNGCFKNHTLFHRALKEALEVFCNEDVACTSIIELLSMFCDDMLKIGGVCEKLSDENLEEKLENIVKLLAYVNNRDLFAKFYKKKLSRGLLFSKSASHEYENFMLTKLKQHYVVQSVFKMEAMFTDIILAKESQKNFKKYLQDYLEMTTPGIDLNVTVLTTTSWPNFKPVNIALPNEMLKCIEAFKGFYNKNTQNRKLTWVSSQGTFNIHGNVGAKTFELIATTCQAALLLLFNSTEKLSYSEIMMQLNINGEDLVTLLHSLSCSKYEILKKTPNTPTVSPNDTFEFNSKFTNKIKGIRIAPPSQAAASKERKKLMDDVAKDRCYTIDAAVVRIKKSQKVLNYQQLLIECVKLLSPMFKLDFRAIKKRTEDLIAHDYLERDKDDPNTFMCIT